MSSSGWSGVGVREAEVESVRPSKRHRKTNTQGNHAKAGPSCLPDSNKRGEAVTLETVMEEMQLNDDADRIYEQMS